MVGAARNVVLQAGLRGVLIAHHTGYSEDGGNRRAWGKRDDGQARLNLTYRYNVGDGSHTDAPVGNKRYLSAFGRDVDVHEFELDYLPTTRWLRVTGGGGRVDAEAERQADRMRDEVLRADAAGEKPNKGELYTALGWESSGRGKAKYDRYYKYAINQKQYVKSVPGKGREVLHVPGDGRPEWRFSMNLDRETGEGEP